MTRVHIEILLYDATSAGSGSVLQRSEIILKPDERRRATIFFGEPSQWDNNDAAQAFRNLKRRWFRADQPGENPFFEFVTRQYFLERIVKNSK